MFKTLYYNWKLLTSKGVWVFTTVWIWSAWLRYLDSWLFKLFLKFFRFHSSGKLQLYSMVWHSSVYLFSNLYRSLIRGQLWRDSSHSGAFSCSKIWLFLAIFTLIHRVFKNFLEYYSVAATHLNVRLVLAWLLCRTIWQEYFCACINVATAMITLVTLSQSSWNIT